MTRPRVANTRPRDQAAELSDLLHAAGFEPFEVPATRIVPSHDPLALRRLRGREYAWFVLPSRNAGRFLGQEIGFHKGGVLCGAATAHALGLRSACTLDPFSSQAALEWLRPRVQPGDHVLIPRAAEGRDELIHGLRQLGIEVDAPIVYRTDPVDTSALAPLADRIRGGEIAAVTFCSPSAVNAVASAIDLTGMRCVCLGPTTADALARHGLHAAAVASSTSMQRLVAAVEQALSSVIV